MVGRDMADSYPHPAPLVGLESEVEFQSWLAGVFDRHGFDVFTEVKSQDRGARVDLIADSEKWGTHGIELKYGEKARPRDWSSAFKQVSRYATKDFGDLNVDNWAVGVAEQLHKEDGGYKVWDERRKRGFLEFLTSLGIGALSFGGRVEIVYNWSNPMVRVPVGNVEYTTGEVVAPELDRLVRVDSAEAHQYLEQLEPEVIYDD